MLNQKARGNIKEAISILPLIAAFVIAAYTFILSLILNETYTTDYYVGISLITLNILLLFIKYKLAKQVFILVSLVGLFDLISITRMVTVHTYSMSIFSLKLSVSFQLLFVFICTPYIILNYKFIKETVRYLLINNDGENH